MIFPIDNSAVATRTAKETDQYEHGKGVLCS
jgi:hypothetical protein